MKSKCSESDLESAEDKRLELDLLHLEFEEEFINNRIVLIILVTISAVLGVLTYPSHNKEKFGLTLTLITMGLGWGFYRTIENIIVAKSEMRKIRKIQELLGVLP